MPADVTIRPYRPADRDELYEICNRTADAGEDSRHRVPDPLLMPSLFAGPYAVLEPDLAFVADAGGELAGYVVATADTALFAQRFRAEWLPPLTARYPPLTGPPRTPAQELVALLHNPERMVLPELAGYPAHLHIDLLPEYRRLGHGRRLIARLSTALRGARVPALHVAMVTANTSARAFYDGLGFHVIPVRDPGPLTYLGLTLSGPGADGVCRTGHQGTQLRA